MKAERSQSGAGIAAVLSEGGQESNPRNNFRERQKRSKEQMYVLVTLPRKGASGAKDPTPVVGSVLRNRIVGPKSINILTLI